MSKCICLGTGTIQMAIDVGGQEVIQSVECPDCLDRMNDSLRKEIERLREQVRVLTDAAQRVIDARDTAGHDAQVALIVAAERCRDAIDAAKAMEANS